LDSRHVDTRGLGRVGYFLGAPYVTLASDRWQATGGTTGVVFSDLAGVNVWGKGASFAGGFERWRVAALAGRPVLGGPANGGHLLATQAGWRVGRGWVSAAASDLEDGQGGTRRLQAIALGGSAPLGSGTTLAAELADRRYAAGDGRERHLRRRRADGRRGGGLAARQPLPVGCDVDRAGSAYRRDSERTRLDRGGRTRDLPRPGGVGHRPGQLPVERERRAERRRHGLAATPVHRRVAGGPRATAAGRHRAAQRRRATLWVVRRSARRESRPPRRDHAARARVVSHGGRRAQSLRRRCR